MRLSFRITQIPPVLKIKIPPVLKKSPNMTLSDPYFTHLCSGSALNTLNLLGLAEILRFNVTFDGLDAEFRNAIKSSLTPTRTLKLRFKKNRFVSGESVFAVLPEDVYPPSPSKKETKVAAKSTPKQSGSGASITLCSSTSTGAEESKVFLTAYRALPRQ